MGQLFKREGVVMLGVGRGVDRFRARFVDGRMVSGEERVVSD